MRSLSDSSITTGVACAQVAIQMPDHSNGLPVNDGSFRNLKVMPMGRVISAEQPCPMRVWMTYPMTVIDTVFKALAPAIPTRAIAWSSCRIVVTSNIHSIVGGGRLHRRHRPPRRH